MKKLSEKASLVRTGKQKPISPSRRSRPVRRTCVLDERPAVFLLRTRARTRSPSSLLRREWSIPSTHAYASFSATASAGSCACSTPRSASSRRPHTRLRCSSAVRVASTVSALSRRSGTSPSRRGISVPVCLSEAARCGSPHSLARRSTSSRRTPSAPRLRTTVASRCSSITSSAPTRVSIRPTASCSRTSSASWAMVSSVR
mmetsp:Transcript_14432/g.43377  ORF Transcript_14432/g.43377 Transcript_14432/m.43377 type:complete len:202 (+) Transcript_14432:2776-3381(+)